jgi:histone H3/H4
MAEENDLEKLLKEFWVTTLAEIQSSGPSQKHCFPLTRIKKIMRFDEEVNMVSHEVLCMFDKCTALFIQELTLRAWQCTLAAKRKTVKVEFS